VEFALSTRHLSCPVNLVYRGGPLDTFTQTGRQTNGPDDANGHGLGPAMATGTGTDTDPDPERGPRTRRGTGHREWELNRDPALGGPQTRATVNGPRTGDGHAYNRTPTSACVT